MQEYEPAKHVLTGGRNDKSFKFILFGILTVVLANMSVASNKSKAADIVAILTCPMGCGVMEGNTLLGTIMAKAGDELIVASQETPGYMYNVEQ